MNTNVKVHKIISSEWQYYVRFMCLQMTYIWDLNSLNNYKFDMRIGERERESNKYTWVLPQVSVKDTTGFNIISMLDLFGCILNLHFKCVLQ